MNEQELIDLANELATLSDEQRLEFLNALPTMPSAEDLASVTNLIAATAEVEA